MEPINETQIEEWLSKHGGFAYTGNTLLWKGEFVNFLEAFSFLEKLAPEMEKQGHHAEIFNIYNKLELKLATHDAGRLLTEKDLKLAQTIEELAAGFDVKLQQ